MVDVMIDFKPNMWPNIEGNEFLLNLGEQWVYLPTNDAPHYGLEKPVKWKEDQTRLTLSDVASVAEHWREQGKDAYPAHFGTGSIAWLDFDDRPSVADANYGEGQTLETAQARYDELLERYCATTYTERSRTPGRYHLAFRLPLDHGLPLRSIKLFHGIDLLIGNGWVRLTGYSNGLPIADIPDTLLEHLQARARQYDFDSVPVSSVEGDPSLCAMSVDEAFFETRRRMIESTSKTSQGFSYRELIVGPCGLDETNLSESRAALIQWAATITCGHKDQHEIVWQIVSNSYLAEQTPYISKQNKRRFASSAKINFDRFNRNGEYQKLIGLANAEVERKRAEADAQREKMAGIALARKERQLGNRDYWQRVPLDDFPVPAYREYRDYLRSSAIKSNERIIEAATLAHMAHLLGNRVAGPTGVFPAIFIIVPAPAGGGKEAASYEAMQRLAPQYTFSLGSPGSGGGFHAALLDPLFRGVGFALIDEYQDFLMGKGDNQHVKSSVTTLKTIYGKMQIGKELPAVRLVKDTRAAVPEPAVTMLGIGIEDDIFEAFAKTSLSDGFFARHLFPDMVNDLGRFRNRQVETNLPPRLLTAVTSRLADLPKPPDAPFARAKPERIPFESEELEEEAYHWACEIDDLREEKFARTRFGEMLRAVSENTYRLATAMGAWSDERKITRPIWEWCKGYAINSVAYLIAKDEAGVLDANTSALTQRIQKAMDQFFDGKGNQHPSQNEMRINGQFRLRSLPNYARIEEAAAKINPANPMMPLDAAIAMLKGRGTVEVFEDNKDFTKRIYCKGPAYDASEQG
jgi:hypothetical protein